MVAEAGVAVTTVVGTRAPVMNRPVTIAPMAVRKRPLVLRKLDMLRTLNEPACSFEVLKHHGGERPMNISSERPMSFA